MLFKMKYIKYLCLFLFFTTTALAQENKPSPFFITPFRYFTSHYQCGGFETIIHLKTHYEDNIFIADVATRNFSEKTSHINTYSAELTNEPYLIIQSKDSPLKLQVPKYFATEKNNWKWLDANGREKQCINFAMHETASPLSLYQDVILQLKNNEISIDEAEKLTKIQNDLPPFHFLPKENQQDILKQYNQANENYFAKLYINIEDGLKNFPLDREELVQNFYNFYAKVSSLFIYPYTYITPHNKAYAHSLLLIMNDRINAIGIDVIPMGETEALAICNRYTLMPHDTLEDWESIFSIAADYIKPQLEKNRPFNLETLTASLQSCPAPEILENLTKIWPEIEKRANNGQYLIEKVKELENTPLTIAAYLNSNYLEIPKEELQKRAISKETYQRIVGKKLQNKAATMQDAIQKTLEVHFLTFNALKDLTPQAIDNNCQEFIGENAKPSEALNILRNQCLAFGIERSQEVLKDKFETILKKAKTENIDLAFLQENHWLEASLIAAPLELDKTLFKNLQEELAKLQKQAMHNAKIEIPASFAMAKDDKQNITILKTCDAIINSNLSILDNLKQICLIDKAAYLERQEELRCKAAIKKSKALPKMLKTELYFDNDSKSQSITLQDLICQMAKHEQDTILSQTGQWLWKNSYIEFLPQDPKKVDVPLLKARLIPMNNGYRFINILGLNTVEWLKSNIKLTN